MLPPQTSCPEATTCSPSSCSLPDCFCSGQDPPVSGTRPQIVYLTFDDALTSQASQQFYQELFGTPTEHNYDNPNGCGIRWVSTCILTLSGMPRATHFVTHQYTDYSLVNKWWHYGHEIASHSIT